MSGKLNEQQFIQTEQERDWARIYMPKQIGSELAGIFVVLVFTLGFFLMAKPVSAQDELCRKWGLLAENIMTRRQSGDAMSSVMKNVEQNLVPLAPSSARLMRAMVIAAYDKPRMSVERNQRREIEDFRNEMELECYKGLSN